MVDDNTSISRESSVQHFTQLGGRADFLLLVGVMYLA
jgi:hypothetical protein